MGEHDSDFLIEYLDEDAQFVQECVERQQTIQESYSCDDEDNLQTLLVKRPSRTIVKRIIEDDVDYHPEDHLEQQSNKRPKLAKKRLITNKKIIIESSKREYDDHTSDYSSVICSDDKTEQSIKQKTELTVNNTIPDYNDPVCLPVRMLKKTKIDLLRTKNWNDLCLDHLKYSSNPRAGFGEVTASKRTVVLKNFKDPGTELIETKIWGKTSIENDKKEKKAVVFTSVLPKYKERKILNFKVPIKFSYDESHTVNEVLLSKDSDNNKDALVAYHVQDALAVVYKDRKRKKENKSGGEENDSNSRENSLQEMVEATNYNLCPSCYQASRRDVTDSARNLHCAVCNKFFVTMYSLLSHLKTHTTKEIRPHKLRLSQQVSSILNYHYKCRICQRKHNTIKKLRDHVADFHKSKRCFKCDICCRVFYKNN